MVMAAVAVILMEIFTVSSHCSNIIYGNNNNNIVVILVCMYLIVYYVDP